LGAIASTCVDDTYTTAGLSVPPINTAVMSVAEPKLLPERVTVLPPAAGPDAGAIAVIDTGGLYTNEKGDTTVPNAVDCSDSDADVAPL